MRINLDNQKQSAKHSSNQHDKRQRHQIESVRSQTDPAEMVPCSHPNNSHLIDTTMSQPAPSSLNWLLSKKSVFDYLNQDAIRRQHKWR